MKTGWQTKTLDEICLIELGKTPYRGNDMFWDKEKRTKNVWLSIADLLNTSGNVISDSKEYISDEGKKLCKIVKKGTLLASFKLTLGRLAFAGKDLYTNEAIAALTIKNEEEISKDYLYHYLTFFDWHGEVKGDTKVKGKTLNKAKLKRIIVCFPSLVEQHRIIKILDEVFVDVANVKKIAEKNLQNSKELLQSYLFDVFSNLNRGWNEKRLDDICEIEYGYTEKAKASGDFRFVRITDTDSNGLLSRENKMFVNTFHGSEKYLLNSGDLLMARTGASAGNVLLFDSNEKAVFASYLIRLRFCKDIVSKLYWYFSKSDVYWRQVRQLSAGAAQPQFNGGVLKQVAFSYPPTIAEQKAIVNKLDNLFSETKKLEGIYIQKIVYLNELRQSVLAKAFVGDL